MKRTDIDGRSERRLTKLLPMLTRDVSDGIYLVDNGFATLDNLSHSFFALSLFVSSQVFDWIIISPPNHSYQPTDGFTWYVCRFSSHDEMQVVG